MRKFSVVASGLLILACNSASPSGGAPVAKNASENTVTTIAPAELPALDPDPREAMLARGVRLMLESEHLQHRDFDDELSRLAFTEFVDRLDPGKLFLLREDVERLKPFADKIDDQLRAGDLLIGRIGAAVLAGRQRKVASTIAGLLESPLDFNVDESIETDSDKLAFANTESELRNRWRRVLKLRVLESIARMEALAESLNDPETSKEDREKLKESLGEAPTDFPGREAKARADLRKSYDGRFSRLEKIEPLEPSERLLNSIASIYDPHSVYLAPAERDNFDIQMTGSLEGIGAVLVEEDHYIGVREIVPGGASWRQGELEAGDLILSVAQQGEEPVDIADMRINQVVQMIRGPKGTTVTLTVKKADKRIASIAIVRDVVEIEAAYARGGTLESKGKKAIGYVALPSFYGETRALRGLTNARNATGDLGALLRRLETRKVGAVILDLRGNGGGLLEHARRITGLFIPVGPVVQTKAPNQQLQVLADDDPRVVYNGEVVVLVDRFSASASEIVAGALQDYRRAVVVGTGPTHGKGTVQMLVDLDRLGGQQAAGPLGVLKLTVQQFFRITGSSTQWRGVVPDIVLPDPVPHVEAGERFLDHAIEWTQVKSLSFSPLAAATRATGLLALSEKRVQGEPAFKRVKERSDFLAERQKDTLVPLALEKWKTRREQLERSLESLDDSGDGASYFSTSHVNYAAASKNVEAERERIDRWKKSLAKDPWVNEARSVALDLLTSK